MKSVILIVLLLWISNALSAELKFNGTEGQIVLTYDERMISGEVLESYLIVHPIGYDPNYHIAPSLRLCIDGDARYFECDSRNLNAPNFLKNAQVNIDIGKRRIETLSRLNQYPELKDLVEYFRASLEFGVWKNERLLDYYRNWNVQALSQPYKRFHVSEATKSVLETLADAEDPDARWKLSFYDWANSVNQVYREAEGEIPSAGWEQFKLKYKITEQVIFEENY